MLLDSMRRAIGTDAPFSTRELALINPGFRQPTLSEWNRKSQVRMLARGWYVFADAQVDLPLLFDVGCQAYSPAYVSLESALSWYELVPETVHAITLVGTRTTRTSATDAATFVWRTVKPCRWFGYRVVEYGRGRQFLIAEAEKAILDYLYLHPGLHTTDDMMSVRLDEGGFAALDHGRLAQWALRFDHARLSRQVHVLEEAMRNA
jgi:predicted transcriptional regulator of viral defense system